MIVVHPIVFMEQDHKLNVNLYLLNNKVHYGLAEKFKQKLVYKKILTQLKE